MISPDDSVDQGLPPDQTNNKKNEFDILQNIYEALKREVIRLKAFEIESKIELLRLESSGITLIHEFQTNLAEAHFENSMLKLAETM
jgi:hypothetical protein